MRIGLFGYSCAAAGTVKSAKAKIATIFCISGLLVEDLVAAAGEALRDDFLARLRALAGALGAAHHHVAAAQPATSRTKLKSSHVLIAEPHFCCPHVLLEMLDRAGARDRQHDRRLRQQPG